MKTIEILTQTIIRYPFNNFLHHHVENIIGSCLESKQDHLIGHVLDECKLVTRILEAEKNSALSSDLTKVVKSNHVTTFIFHCGLPLSSFFIFIYPLIFFLQHTLSTEGRCPPRIGIVGHMTRIANKLLQLANTNIMVQSYLQV
jgi:serine/threonine-protein phosphatase 6 regulatory subunit 3